MINMHSRDIKSRIVAALEQFGGMTAAKLSEVTGIDRPHLHAGPKSSYLGPLIAENKIHISGWTRPTSGPNQAIFSAGPGEQAPRPSQKTKAQVSRDMRARQREQKKTSNTLWAAAIGNITGGQSIKKSPGPGKHVDFGLDQESQEELKARHESPYYQRRKGLTIKQIGELSMTEVTEELLKGHPLTAGDISEAIGMPRCTVKTQLKKLIANGRVVRDGPASSPIYFIK